MGRLFSKEIELLAPAGNFEKLEIALHYGADAVYLGGEEFSLRSYSGNFGLEQIQAAVGLAHDSGARVYVAVNVFARPANLAPIEAYIRRLGAIGPDGLIVADPAVIAMSRRIAPQLPLHLSTQANTTNQQAVKFWQAQGISRINAARELSLAEIAELVAGGDTVEIEAFVHGAMCISYSGRCLLSNYMAERPSNQGMCCQPCRFEYAVMEETRPGQFFPIAEDKHGTYIFNSKDLCMIDHLPAMIRTGVRALKIEGRMKGIHYAATAVSVYRQALDAYFRDPENYSPDPDWRAELEKITSRGYCTGFYLGQPGQTTPSYLPSRPPEFSLAAKVLAPAGKHKAHVEVRNQLRPGDAIEIITPGGPAVPDKILEIIDLEGRQLAKANPGSRATVLLKTDCRRLDLFRRKISA